MQPALAVVLADLAPTSRPWGWWRLARGPRGLTAVPGLRFAKLMGSGHEGGFGLRPSVSLQALLAWFDDESAAAEFIERAPLVRQYRARARDCLTLRLLPYSCRGAWDGRVPVAAVPAPVSGPVAALTRATLRLRAAPAFWRHAIAAEADLVAARGCRLAIGLGEAPLLRQATFSIWDSVAALQAYAQRGAHRHAIAAARDHQFFRESMFVRFVVRAVSGCWKGRVDGGL